MLENFDTFLEKFVARVEILPLFVVRIIAMFDDQQDGIDGQVVTATAQGFGNRGIDSKPELACPVRALIIRWSLIDVERHNLHIGAMPTAAHRIADQKAVAKMLGMREIAIDRGDDGNPFWGFARFLWRGCLVVVSLCRAAAKGAERCHCPSRWRLG